MDTAQITLIVPPLEPNIGSLILSKSIIADTRKYPSLGLGYIAAVLEKAGYSINYFDMDADDLNLRDLLSRLKKAPPKIVGITCDLITFHTAKKIASAIKREFSDTYLIVGGPHTPIYEKELLINSEFDASVRGEGENTIIELVDALSKGQSLKQIKGISFKENGIIYVNENRPLIKKLDEIPFPARHLMPINKYYSVVARKRKFTTILASRGCPFHCIYCLEQGPLRLRSPRNIVDEIELAVNEYGITEFFFQDSTFTMNIKHIENVCKEILKRKLNIIWECRTRVDRVNLNLLRWMKAAGCNRIHYGIEAGNPRILKILNKKITLEQTIKAVKWTKEAGIEILTYFMIGSPGENLRTIEDTIQFAKKLETDFALFTITTPGPGTPIYENALKEGFFKKDHWKDYILGNIQELPRLAFITEEYDREALTNLLKRAYFQFYFRPRTILKRLQTIKSARELINNFRGAFNLFKSFFEKF